MRVFEWSQHHHTRRTLILPHFLTSERTSLARELGLDVRSEESHASASARVDAAHSMHVDAVSESASNEATRQPNVGSAVAYKASSVLQ